MVDTRQALHDPARMRAQELKGFVDGLFGSEDEMLLPKKAHEAVVALSELHAMFDGAAALLADEAKPAPVDELKSLLRNVQQMTIIADEQINKAVHSCKRARGQRLEAMATVMSRKIVASEREGTVERDVTKQGDDKGPEFIESPLSQTATRNGCRFASTFTVTRRAAGSWKSSMPRTLPMCGTSTSRRTNRP